MSDPDNRDPHARNRSLLDIYRAQEAKTRLSEASLERAARAPASPAPDTKVATGRREHHTEAGEERKSLARLMGDNPLIAALSRRLKSGQHDAADAADTGPKAGQDAPARAKPSDIETEASETRSRERRRPVAVPVVPVAEPAAEDSDPYWRPLIDPATVIMGVIRSKWLIAGMTLLGAVLGVLMALSTPKDFYAATELLFDPRDIQIVDRDLTQGGLPSDATLALIENQVRVIGSGLVLGKVVDRLDLQNDPEFNGQAEAGILDTLTNPRTLLSWGGAKADAATRATLAIDHLAKSLDVRRNEKTFIIDIGVTTHEAEKSARIANTVASVFIETYGDLQSRTATRANDEITRRLDELRSSVEQTERAVADFKARHDIVDAQGRLISEDSIIKLNDQLSAARARAAELKSRADSANAVDTGSVLSGALPEQVASSALAELRAQYASLKQQADSLANRLGPRHPDLLSLQAQLAGLRQQIGDELNRVVASLHVDLTRAEQTEQELSARLARAKAQKAQLAGEQVQLNELQREADSRRAVYEAFLQRARETGQQRGLNTGNVNIISKAFAPLDPDGPSRAVIAIVGMILGFLAGIALGAARGVVRSFRDNAAHERPARSAPHPVAASARIMPMVVPAVSTDPRTAGGEPASEAADDHRLDLRGTLDAAPFGFSKRHAADPETDERSRQNRGDGQEDVTRTRAEIDALRHELRGFRREVDALMAARDSRRAG